jgi:hypothetical protein
VQRESRDENGVLDLIRVILAGQEGAWTALVTVLHPRIDAIVRASHSLGPLRAADDHCRTAATNVLAKLARNQYRALSLVEHWLVARPDKAFDDWLTIVCTNVVREYVGQQLGQRRDDGSNKRWLHTLAAALPEGDDTPAVRAPLTDLRMASEIMQFAAEHLPVEQVTALSAWLQQRDFAEIGKIAGLSDEHARGGERLVRAALARLRREFNDQAEVE